MFIYVCCAGGGSSSLFCARITQAIKATDENLTACFVDLTTVRAAPLAYATQADLIFVYGPAGAIRPAEAFDYGSLFDVVFVAPQVRYLLPQIQRCLADYPTVVTALDSQVFGMMDGARGRSTLLEQLMVLDWQRGYASGRALTTKRGDKSLEVLVYGASRSDRAIQELVAALAAQGIRCVQERFALDRLYDRTFTTPFEVRLLFGAEVTARTAAKVARRIDGVLRFTTTPTASARPHWDTEYRIPVVRLDARLLARRGDRTVLVDQVLAFLQTVDAVAQGTQSVSVAHFETAPPPRPTKTLLGLLTYR
ncbi:PTS sugar transporter subunit IIB [Lacticaseibacillus absianus]|uniref:PTS sugar transporter subunit IIB n=1 Tax=Lacticaseibacillus absianus TaxID=2729623 RepID=UPI0015CDB56F|nr:hypothetical protein [Lacticaseibacillus absianus]